MSLIRLRKCTGETVSSLFAIRYIFDRRKTLFSLAQNDTHTHNTHTYTHTHTRTHTKDCDQHTGWMAS